MLSKIKQKRGGRWIGPFFGLWASFFAFPARAKLIFSDTLWESRRIEGAIFSAVGGDFDHDGRAEVAYLLPKKIVLGRLEPDGQIAETAVLPAGERETFHRLSVGDFNADGGTDFVVTGFVGDRAFSRMLVFTEGRLAAGQEWSGVVAPLFWRGEERLFRQALSSRGEWGQELSELVWRERAFAEPGTGIRLGRGIGGQAPSLYALAGMDGELAWAHPEGPIVILDADGKRRWKSGVRFGGPVDWVDFAQKDPLGVRREVKLLLPPRLAYDAREKLLYAAKNNGFLPSALGAFPNLKSSKYTVLAAAEESGLQEQSASKTYDGAISDVQLMDFDGDGVKNELLLALWSRQGGVFDASRPKISVLVVVRGEGTPPPLSPPEACSGAACSPSENTIPPLPVR